MFRALRNRRKDGRRELTRRTYDLLRDIMPENDRQQYDRLLSRASITRDRRAGADRRSGKDRREDG